MVRMMFLYFLLFHIFSSFWFFIGSEKSNLDDAETHDFLNPEEDHIAHVYVNGWIKGIKSVVHYSQYVRIYLRAIYFVVATFVTVGYGDMAPVTISEYFFMMVLMYSGQLLFSYILGQIR